MQKTIPQFNVHEAKTNLSRLIEMAVRGEPFIIARAGKPAVIVSAYEPPHDPAKRTGFLKGRYNVPDDFDSMGKEEVQALFEGSLPTARPLKDGSFTGRQGEISS